jgi:hypothetical protein
MTVTPNVPAEVYTNLSPDNIAASQRYINAKMTATTITELAPQRGLPRVITAEIIYLLDGRPADPVRDSTLAFEPVDHAGAGHAT